MKLVICEKPSVGAAVAAALGVREKKDGYIEGNGYVISWCIGHLVGLAEAAAYGEQYRKWSYDSLPILPQEWQYTVAADKGKQFKILKDLMQRSDVSEVVNACDAGREGELIFRFVYVDSFGYKEVPEFLQEQTQQPEKINPLKHVEDTIEQNDNNFDGIINNTPTVDELEAKVKAGEQISLVDLAEAIKADKERGKEKPSIRAQLKADKERTGKKKNAKQKSQDLERS